MPQADMVQINTDSPQLQTLNFAYVPRPGLLKITIINALLGIVTLSLYRFWAKTNVRRHIWSCIHINGEPLEYTGTGKELFLGALMVFVLFVLPIVILFAGLNFWLGPGNPALVGLQLMVYLLISLFWGFAVYKARKYQLSRTLWRGIRGTLSGSAVVYSLTNFGAGIARAMSLGWATPVMDTVLQEQLIGNMQFGDTGFKFRGKPGRLYPPYALCWILTMVILIGGTVFVGYEIYAVAHGTMGEAMDRIFSTKPEQPKPTSADFWQVLPFLLTVFFALVALMVFTPILWIIYYAAQMRRFAEFTRFDGAQFRLAATTSSLAWLTVSNLLLLVSPSPSPCPSSASAPCAMFSTA